MTFSGCASPSVVKFICINLLIQQVTVIKFIVNPINRRRLGPAVYESDNS